MVAVVAVAVVAVVAAVAVVAVVAVVLVGLYRWLRAAGQMAAGEQVSSPGR